MLLRRQDALAGVYWLRQEGRAAAPASPGRKVRTPPGRVLGNAQAQRCDGKCHRDHSADGPAFAWGTGKRETVR